MSSLAASPIVQVGSYNFMLSKLRFPLRDSEAIEMDEIEKKLLDKAIRKRDLLVRSIQRVCTQIENMVKTDDNPKNALEAAKIDRDDLEKKLAEFHDTQSQVEMDVEDEDLAAHENERTRVETIARSAKVVLADFIAEHSEPTSHNSSVRRSLSTEASSDRKIKRPEIQIPKFEGDYRKWNDFKNVFESLVVDEAAFTNVEKMVYLKQAMQKNAADVIRKFEITDKNFDKAWEKLKKRYENRRATINNHLQSLTQLPLAKSEAGLQKLLDAASDAIESLDAMGVKDGWSYMVSYLVTEKLDPETRKAWEIETVKEAEYPKYENLEAFLQQRVRVIESMGSSNSRMSTSSIVLKKPDSSKTYSLRKSLDSANVAERRCFDCQENHAIADCEKFAAKSLSEKTELIKKRGLCFQCLCKGHMVLSCRAPRCAKCGKRHHILLHVDVEKSVPGNEKISDENKTELKKSFCTTAKEIGTFLPSALVLVSQGENKKILARTFLDSCSEVNLISESLVKRLKCSRKKSNVVLETAMPGSLSIAKCCRIKIESRSRDYFLEADFQIASRIANDFIVYDTSKYKNKNIDFADDPKLGGSRVDLLIGAEFFEAVMLSGRFKQLNEPYLRETMFGWVAIGVARSQVGSDVSKCYLTIQDQLQQFFVLEDVSSARNSWTLEEVKCDEHFESTYSRNPGGFEVALPKGLSLNFLGESRFIAFKQFCALERRLSDDEFVVYKGFMDEYIHLGHMTLIEKPDPSEFRCYLPHHAVYKKSSTTTGMRAVFNASCPTATGYSLNDVLMKGPVLQDDLFSILLRFRCKKVAFTADIAKMYRQVSMRKEDRRLQCVLWRDKPSEPIRTYELNTVTYGTKPASYLATKCLSKLADECDGEFPETATIIRQDFYMDDLLTGGSSVKEVKARLRELRQILGDAGFPLRKFASNSLAVLDGLDSDCVENTLEIEGEEQSVGVLGLRWLTAVEDRLVFYARLPQCPNSWSKREILSEVSRIFDPLGLLSPITVTLKVILQSLWANQVGWDDLIVGDVVDRYLSIRDKLTDLPAIYIPRFVGEVSKSEFHIFCDASEKAFGAAVYLRHQSGDNVVVRLLCAKTRVAPVKKISLPRLELCGAVLAAKLFSKVRIALKLTEETQVVAWTDSTIVLSWLARPEHSWCTFVANRVTKVSEVLPTSMWHHVRSQDNAADIISRGIESGQFEELEKFLIGPRFLQQHSFSFSELVFDNQALCEEKKKSRVFLATTECWITNFFDRFSTYSKLIRTVAYLCRFAENSALEKYSRTFDNLSVHECNLAHITVVKLAQRLIDVKKLEKIDHFFDADGIIRLRSRMSNAELSERVKYPILLPKCKFLTLLIEHFHVKFFHANCLFLRNFINLEYFVLASLNRLIRTTVYKCITCRRFIPNLEFKIPVGQLPAARVNAAPAFVEVGVDFAGPFTTRAVGPSGNRGKVLFKSYVSVFVCMVTRACHLEVVEDLSTKCFLDAFSRFVSRRGMCSNVYSDHGTNFVGADRELRAAFELVSGARDEIGKYAVSQGICWHFIPQRAPNFGGLWEAAVKSFKSHFRKVVGSQILSFVELFTLVTQIEAVLNSRPLCASDSIANCFITPSHLCIGRSLMIIPELPGDVVTGSQLVRYKLLRGMLERFWSVWHNEYLIALRKSTLSVKENRVPLVGELVLVKDESTSPSCWPLARIIKLFYGQDDIARVADVQLGAKILRRPIIKLIPLLPETPVSQGGGGC